MSDRSPGAAWDAFWREQAAGSSARPGCLPRGHGLDTVLSAAWRSFAATLPPGARALDVGTGDGRVMGWMISERSDLKLEGVDLAATLPRAPTGTLLRSGIAMEQLPYEGDEFAASVSQFGFEYGDLWRTSAELARVVVPGGSIALVTHRKDGPILAQNEKRRREIEWATAQQNLGEVARNAIGLAPEEPLPEVLANAPARGRDLFGPRSAAWEIAEALRLTVDMGRADDPAKVSALITQIEDKARGESNRISALEAACEQISDEAAVSRALRDAGLIQREIHPVRLGPGAPPFADFRLIIHA